MKTWTDVQDAIYEVAQKELAYDSDHLTVDGWIYIENKAPIVCLELIKEDFEEEDIGELSEEDIQSYFNNALSKAPCLLRCND